MQQISGNQIGRMSDLITITRKVKLSDQYGQLVPIADGVTSNQVFALVMPLNAREDAEGHQLVQGTVYQVTVRYQEDLVRPTDTASWNGGKFEIENIHVIGRKQLIRFNITTKDNGALV